MNPSLAGNIFRRADLSGKLNWWAMACSKLFGCSENTKLIKVSLFGIYTLEEKLVCRLLELHDFYYLNHESYESNFS